MTSYSKIHDHSRNTQSIAQSLTSHEQTAPRPAPQDQQEIDPNPSLTYSLRDPEVTDFDTQNGTSTATTTESTTEEATASPAVTEIASFTVPNGGIYTAIAVDGTASIAGHVLTVGGPDALVGGVRVSAGSDGFQFGGATAAYATVTGSSTVEVVSTVTDEQGSSTGVVSSSSTVAVAESSATELASPTESGGEDASSTTSEGEAAAESSPTGGAAGGATAMSKAAFTGLGGLAVLLCVFG